MKMMARVFSGLMCAMILFCGCIGVFANDSSQSTTYTLVDEVDSYVEYSNVCVGAYISLETEQYHFDASENIEISYKLSVNEGIVSYNYDQSGLENVSIVVDDIRIKLTFSCCQDISECSLLINVSTETGKQLSAMLYTICTEYGVFISPYSLDDAYERYYYYAKQENIISEKEYETIQGEVGRESIVTRVVKKSISTTETTAGIQSEASSKIIEGGLIWDDYDYVYGDGYDGNAHPLRRVKVELRKKRVVLPSVVIETTTTDDYGMYYLGRQVDITGYNIDDLFIRVYAGIDNAMVKKGSVDEAYFTDIEIPDDYAESIRIDVVTMMNDFGYACQISQALITARDYAEEMLGHEPEDIIVKYPAGETCKYTVKDNLIFDDEKLIYVIGNNENHIFQPYASWDTIMHEYGHHIEKELGMIGLTDKEFERMHDGKGSDGHSVNTNQADAYQSKALGVRLAWVEGWATVFGIMAQQYYSEYLEDINTVGDEWNTDYQGINYSLNKYQFGCGEANEESISAILWDLYDSDEEDAEEWLDTIAIGHTGVWNIINQGGIQTFSDFINEFYDMFPEFIDDIAPNLCHYKMASSKPSISSNSIGELNTRPSFSWSTQGGSVNFCNNKFSLIFYDAEGNQILRTMDIETDRVDAEVASHKLTQDEWNTLLTSGASVYTVAVSAKQTSELVTGEYISERSNFFVNPACSSIIIPDDVTRIVSDVSLAKKRTDLWFVEYPNLENVIFENPFGWKVGSSSIEWQTLLDPYAALEYLMWTYSTSNWYTSYIASGEINDTLKWCLCEDGTLGIYGSGSIPNYINNSAPWSQYKDSITNIVITGVDFIGSKAFYNLDKVTTVYISDTVTIIDAFAFEGCTALVSVEFESLSWWMVGEIISNAYIDPYDLVYPDIAAECLKSTYCDECWERQTSMTTTLSLLDRGSCGDGIYWALTSEYDLRIYGSGEMDDLAVYPWAEYSENITSITVASGVIHIGDYAFENCGADSVSLPEGLLSIGEGAFKGCAFSAITLPSMLTTIEGQAFADCTALTSINIPALVSSIGERAFEGCSALTSMTVDSENTVYSSINNCIIDIAAKTIIAGCNGSVIPEDENVTTIGRYAFAGCGFTSISIPSTITEIEYRAFYGCTALTSVNLSDTLSRIGDGMFEGCVALSSITIPSNVTEIGAGAFKDCTALTEITIPASVSTIGEGAFAYSGVTVLNFSRVNDWTYGNGIAVSESALEGASAAAALLKGDMVNYTITRSPLMSEALTSTTYWEISHDGALIIYGYGDMADYSDGEAPWVAYTDLFNAVKIKEGICYVGRCSFYDLDNITSVSLPESLMVIGTYAFYSCNGFNTLNIPAKVFKIGAYALRKTKITNFTMDSPNGWKSNGIQFSGDVAEIYLNLKGDIVNGVSFTAYKHSFLRDDVCEGDVIASGEFANGRMSWTLNDKGVLTLTGSGAMPEFYTGIIPWESYMSAIRRVVIGEGITTVGRCSFPSCSTLEEVTLPSTLTHINAYAFAYCKSLKEIEIPESVIFIADSAFTDSGITDVPTV